MEQTYNINTLGTRFSRQALGDGMRDGVPIGLGYFAVSFSLGIAAKNAGLTPFQGFLASLLCNASAGEYAGFTLIAAGATYLELAVVTLIANARYLLMSCAMSQRLDPAMPGFHRPLMAFHITDELFGIAIARPGCLNPFYSYGAVLVAAPCWAVGTALGAIAGGLLPLRLVSAFSVALYGMFLAVIIPAARQSKVIAWLIVLCFGASYGAAHLPAVSRVSGGTRTIILTVVLSAAAALLFPQNTEEDETNA
ncbi:MAG: AzlC family ABC transporter permease [Ruminococcus sp.]|nr:AzlC family ABC transporter permease [uncultured Schaedlerella sp.]MCI9212298.1 AzlC family ABC transporter permease [Ruminococcus sp.]